VGEQVDVARKMIAEQQFALEQIVEKASEDADFAGAYERMVRWKARTVGLLSDLVAEIEANRLKGKRKMSLAIGDPFGNLAEEGNMYRGFLEALDEQLSEHPEDVLNLPVPAEPEVAEVQVPDPGSSRTVFIIHGHDELNLLRLKELLKERWQLNPVVLSGKAGKGRTLIEKFEQEAPGAVFAIALMTPDDVVAVDGQEYGQARPNVVFELGWFYGRLGRSRVCILLKEGSSIHSDLNGISRIDFQESVTETLDQLERELQEAGVLTT